jgi:hypothetical protein
MAALHHRPVAPLWGRAFFIAHFGILQLSKWDSEPPLEIEPLHLISGPHPMGDHEQDWKIDKA